MKILLAVAVLLVPGCTRTAPPDMSKTKQEVRDKYPTVRQMPTADLARRLADSSQPAPVLVDVRLPAEYAVSHLSGARNVPPGTSPTDALKDVPKDATIVAYCSVGYRSSAFAQKLAKAGYTSVWNLEGSMFEWANEGRPIVDDKGPAKVVHPYDAKWGQLLRPELRAQVKDAE